MPSFQPPTSLLLYIAILLILHAGPAFAFGAGNIASISAIEGQNWRHGDIEDTLLNLFLARSAGGKKFSALDVKRVYFGNWLRDYSQAVDVGTVKYVSAEAIRLILWVLGFMSFGYATGEFEVTMDRLGCYRPEEHIDNPKDYADNLDARQYDRRLRGPVDERRELSVNPQTGIKNYIASESMGITTSAGLVRNLFGRCIQLGRQYSRSKDKKDLYEAFRLLGTGCHCLEDWSAHTNYVELALIELGERNVFPFVGRNTQLNLPGARQSVYPVVTGTFGGVDFLHSVLGEFGDKAAQSEIQELQGTIESSQTTPQNVSLLRDLLAKIPSGMFGGQDQAGKVDELQSNAQAAQMQNTHISPKQPEAFTRQVQEISKQIYPILEWRDEIVKSITEMIDQIPVLPDLIDQLTAQMNIFVFTLIAPLVLPVINQVKTELNEGSSEIIQSSKDKQLNVFHDDRSSDPTHSMLSKDHFSNILNEPAGKTASYCLTWVVPQIMACWDDERSDPTRTINRIVNGVFHHPSLRDQGEDGAADCRRGMFNVVQQWWGQKSERERSYMRDQLSRDGVEQGRNHKPGVHDSGHGCGKPLGMPNMKTAGSSGAIGGIPIGNVLGQISSALQGQSQYDSGSQRPDLGIGNAGKFLDEAVGGGVAAGLLGGLSGGVGADLLGGSFGGSSAQKVNYGTQGYGQDGSYTQNYTQAGYAQSHGTQQPTYGQAQYSQTSYQDGGRRQEYQKYEQGGRIGGGGYGEQVIQETRPTYGGGYEQTTELRHENPGGAWESEVRHETRRPDGETYGEKKHYEGYDGYKKNDDDDEQDEYKREKHKKHHKKHDDEDESEGYVAPGAYGVAGRFNEERRQEYNEGYPGERKHGYGAEPRYEEPQIPGGFGAGTYGGGRRTEYEEERPAYGGGGFGGREEYGGGYGRREQEEREERERVEREQRERLERERLERAREEEYGGERRYGGEQEYGGGRREEEYGEDRGYGQEERYEEREERREWD